MSIEKGTKVKIAGPAYGFPAEGYQGQEFTVQLIQDGIAATLNLSENEEEVEPFNIVFPLTSLTISDET